MQSTTAPPQDLSLREDAAETGVDVAIEKSLAARAKAVDWIHARISPTGEPCGAREMLAYYRVPWALALAGDQRTAARVLTWIERNALTPSGDLRADADPGATFVERWASYPLAILAIGAWHLERDDTALAIMRTLSAYQDSNTGGAFAERPNARVSGRQDLFPTAQLGMAALTTDQMEIAHGANRWIRSLYDAQPDLPRRLYTATNGAELMVSPDPSIEWEVITDFTQPKQGFYNPGIAAAFLARYAMQTGDERAVPLARAYLKLSEEGTPAQFDYRESAQICKFAWGASLMLIADPAGAHLHNVLRMVDWFCDSQQPDGRWHDSPFLSPDPTEAEDLEITAEFALHLSTVIAGLAGRRGA
jgi:hypothetical protein